MHCSFFSFLSALWFPISLLVSCQFLDSSLFLSSECLKDLYLVEFLFLPTSQPFSALPSYFSSFPRGTETNRRNFVIQSSSRWGEIVDEAGLETRMLAAPLYWVLRRVSGVCFHCICDLLHSSYAWVLRVQSFDFCVCSLSRVQFFFVGWVGNLRDEVFNSKHLNDSKK